MALVKENRTKLRDSRAACVTRVCKMFKAQLTCTFIENTSLSVSVYKTIKPYTLLLLEILTVGFLHFETDMG